MSEPFAPDIPEGEEADEYLDERYRMQHKIIDHGCPLLIKIA
jgi:hypothetical protein